jgi:hypothetical protein
MMATAENKLLWQTFLQEYGGSSMNQKDAVELDVEQALFPIPARAAAETWSRTQRTKAVKQALVDLAKKYGCKTAASQCKTEQESEWLYDVVWFQSDDSNDLIDVPLVVESEWLGENNLKDDFQKLLVARAKHRLMVFQGRSEKEVRMIFDSMRGWIRKYHGTAKEDRYLLAGWTGSDTNRFLFDLYVH